MIPLTFAMVIFQSSSFWTSLLACCIFKEPLFMVEMIAMVVCFGGMVTITLSGAKASASTEGDAPLQEVGATMPTTDSDGSDSS